MNHMITIPKYALINAYLGIYSYVMKGCKIEKTFEQLVLLLEE